MHWNTNIIIITINVKLGRRQKSYQLLTTEDFSGTTRTRPQNHCLRFSELLNLQTLQSRRRHLRFFLIEVYNGTKFCSLVLEIADICVRAMNISSFYLFRNSSSCLPASAYVRVGEPS